jgi:VWFA-related protein
MRVRGLVVVSVFLAASALATIAAPPTEEGASAPQQLPSRPAPLKTNTRLIAIDVVATDSHGNIVRGLTAEDFKISEQHAGQQKVAQFQFVDISASPATELARVLPAKTAGVYSNVASARFKVPPTVILMDALNTSIYRQIQVRRDMILFLKKLPPDTPVAVFLLGHTLHVVQSFTTDPALLRDAVDSAHRPENMIQRQPQDDPDSASFALENSSPNASVSMIQSLQDFEAQQYVAMMDQRVDETADAMRSVAKYLAGYPGRKNLIWFSESFPIWIEPTADFGSDPFIGSTTYGGKVREAADALTDARVAVYPVDARALEGPQAYSASNENMSTPGQPGGAIGGALAREDWERIDSQATMDEIADETGGKTCKDTNDLAGCVKRALDESSSYYELGYYPENVKWDGQFHKITVKTERKGIKLSYRRGYYALDVRAIANQTPDALLKDACLDDLPSTSIPLTAAVIEPKQHDGKADPGARYLLIVSPGALSLAPVDGLRSLSVKMAICEYQPKQGSFQFYEQDLSRPVPDAVYQSWQVHGFRNIFDYGAKPSDQRLRFVVLDVPSGATGAIDVPAHPREFASEPGNIVPVASPGAASPPGPAPAVAKAPEQAITQLTFRSSSGGASSLLDWSGDKLWYHGDLGINLGAPALFRNLFESRYHCDAGKLVSNDPNSTAPASYLLSFRSPSGSGALVELGGESPAYSGNLPVDTSARAFFDYLWKLCHCQQP